MSRDSSVSLLWLVHWLAQEVSILSKDSSSVPTLWPTQLMYNLCWAFFPGVRLFGARGWSCATLYFPKLRMRGISLSMCDRECWINTGNFTPKFISEVETPCWVLWTVLNAWEALWQSYSCVFYSPADWVLQRNWGDIGLNATDGLSGYWTEFCRWCEGLLCWFL
jgi:hypothetical protein